MLEGKPQPYITKNEFEDQLDGIFGKEFPIGKPVEDDEEEIKEKMEEWKDLSLPELQELVISKDDKIGQEIKMQVVERKIDKYLDSKEGDIRKIIQVKTGKTGLELETLVEEIKKESKQKY